VSYYLILRTDKSENKFKITIKYRLKVLCFCCWNSIFYFKIKWWSINLL